MMATAPRRWARIAGGLYLTNIIGGAFAIGYVPAVLVVPGDAAATARNIVAHALLYRVSLVVHLIVILTNIPSAMLFYELFRVVGRRSSWLMVGFLLMGTAVEGAYLLNQFVPLLLVDGGHSVSGLTTEQLQAQVSLPFDLATTGYSIAQVIYVGYLLLTGYLIVRSTFFPRIVGVLLAMGGVGYLIYSFADLLAPRFATHLVPYIQFPSLIGEGSLCLVLLVIGVNEQRWKEQASTAAPALRH
jgi:hypothetical protein